MNYTPLHAFAEKHRVPYNELCAAVRDAGIGEAEGNRPLLDLLAQCREVFPHDNWIDIRDRKPKCSRVPGSQGVEVLISPRIDDLGTAFYGRRVTNSPAFYHYGAVLHGVTHWQPLPDEHKG